MLCFSPDIPCHVGQIQNEYADTTDLGPAHRQVSTANGAVAGDLRRQVASPSEYASPVARLSSQQQAAGDDTYDSLQRHGPDRNGGSAVMTGSERQRSAICHSLATSFGGEDDVYATVVRSVDDDHPYQEPPGTVEDLYSHLQQPVYQQINRSAVTLGKELGSGEFGTVVEGVLNMNERSIPVAVKILNKNNADAKKSLLQEAALMGQFNHINVVRLVGVVTRADPVLVVLELMSGGDLRSHLHKLQPERG
eukprot:scpid98207/ scgid7920/ Insulin receptor-related protein; IR-related receptor; Insulin receptor-related protein alpha chain; Insulin receptor-related protein beta chain